MISHHSLTVTYERSLCNDELICDGEMLTEELTMTISMLKLWYDGGMRLYDDRVGWNVL